MRHIPIICILLLACGSMLAVMVSEVGGITAAWVSNGSGDGQFDYPAAIATVTAGSVSPVDQYGPRIEGSPEMSPPRVLTPATIPFNRAPLTVAPTPVSTADTYVVTAAWGSNGSGDGQFYYPEEIAVDGAGNVYVTEEGNHRVQKFDQNGSFLETWSGYGSDFGGFADLSGTAVDPAGNVYFTDRGGFRVLKVAPNGTLLAEWGTEGSEDGQFNSPFDLTVDESGFVYVTDMIGGTPRITKFTTDGTFVTKWETHGEGELYSDLRGIAADRAGRIHTVDHVMNRTLTFTTNGTLLAEWGTGTEGQFVLPWDIAVDREGNVYVTEEGNHRVQKFASNGTFRGTWGTWGSGLGQFDCPRGIAVDSAGSVYVVDHLNHRVQKFAKEETAPPLTPKVTPTPTPLPPTPDVIVSPVITTVTPIPTVSASISPPPTTTATAESPGVNSPRDLDGDGLFEDWNGNGRTDFQDVVLFFSTIGSRGVYAQGSDFNGNGRTDFADVVWLFNNL